MNVHKYLAKITKIIKNNKLIVKNVYFLSLTLHFKSTFSELFPLKKTSVFQHDIQTTSFLSSTFFHPNTLDLKTIYYLCKR